jgi:hypothetical protein
MSPFAKQKNFSATSWHQHLDVINAPHDGAKTGSDL